MENVNLEYIKIYKDLTYGSYKQQLVYNNELAAYTINLFNSDYDSVNEYAQCVAMCERHGITTYTEYCDFIHNYIRSVKHISRQITNRNVQVEPSPLAKELMFAKLDPNKTYLAIDVKHAISQYVDSLNIIAEPIDKVLIDGIKDEYISNNKTFRMFIYNQFKSYNFNNNLIGFTYSLMNSDHALITTIKSLGLEIVACNLDELVFDITNHKDVFVDFIGEHTINGIEVKVLTFIPHYISYIDPETNATHTVSIRYNPTTGKTNFQGRSCKYLNQIFKYYYNIPITDEDLYVCDTLHKSIYYKLDNPITIVSNE